MAVPHPTVRNALECQRCASRLVVECEQAVDQETGRKISFSCPACRGWNAEVRVTGSAMERVFLDPRGQGRARR
jgi:Zn finger protein HypA/HybF involved in hydrogenase expression